MHLLKKIVHFFLFGNVFVAICAYFQTLNELYFSANLKLVNPTSLFVFFSTLLIYNYRKLLFAERDLKAPYTERAKWVFSNRTTLAVICISSVIGIIISLFKFSEQTFFFLFPLFIISVLYATPFSRNMDSMKRLRQLPFLKIFLVAGVWSAVTVLFPVIENDFHNLISSSVIFSFFARAVFIFSITLPFDIRDIEVDKKNGIKTFPVVLGEKKAVVLSMASMLLFIFLQFTGLYFHLFESKAMGIGYLFSGIVSLLFIAQSSSKQNEYFVAFWIEGLMLLQFILLLVAHVLLT